MADFRQANQKPAGELVKLFYPELRRIAAARMGGERGNHTLQPTVLINEPRKHRRASWPQRFSHSTPAIARRGAIPKPFTTA